MIKRILAVTALFLAFENSNAQENYSLGFSLGAGKNYFHNDYKTDANHFDFRNPLSIGIGVQSVRYFNAKNQIVFNLGFTSKKIKFEYDTNEPNIPYNVNEKTTEKFNCLSLSVGYRKPFHLKKYKLFAQIDLVADYNLHVGQAVEGEGNSIGDAEISEELPVLYQSSATDNVGEKTFTVGSILGLGFNFGKRKHSELSLNVTIPFSNIQNKTTTYQYNWQYSGREYVHNLSYKGNIIYPNIKFTHYVFNK